MSICELGNSQVRKMHSNSFKISALSLSALLFSPVILASPWAPWATAIDRTGWTVSADSYQAGNEVANVLDGNNGTFWHTAYSPAVAPLPHNITIDMKKPYVINGFSVLPRQDGNSNGNIGQHVVQVSTDGSTWQGPITFGTYLNDATQKTTYFSSTVARYVRLLVTTEAQGNNNQWTSAAEINVYSPDPTMNASTFTPPAPASKGRWDVTIDLPIVLAAGAVAYSGDIIFWSAFRPDLFSGGTGVTQTAVWNVGSQTVTQRAVTNTGHDMFCPGISLDSKGRIIVTGGNDNKKTSIYDPSMSAWAVAAQMNIGRGYQAQVTISDGRIFVIGGSWSGGLGGKNGEIYSPTANTWTNVSGCSVTPMLTNDAGGIFRQDNHAWLFAWKANSIFQGGPSKAMNWYNVSGTGSYTPAGTRASDSDSMCGNAVMYDAVAGKILTIGGSPSYQDSYATSNAHIITLGSPNVNPSVATISSMSYARAFGNSVVLPNGQVLVFGGQSYAVPFTDTTPALVSELFNPSTNSFSQMAPIAVPRTYHSIGLLLPDARVLSGGGGLCGTNCQQNHFDAQLYSPPYLFNSDGSAATRPTIKSVSTNSFRPGTKFSVTVDRASTFSLIRIGSSTHTVNTDQRRIPLTATASGLTYTMTLPTDPGILVPGYWMLFAINSNVPSVAKMILVTT